MYWTAQLRSTTTNGGETEMDVTTSAEVPTKYSKAQVDSETALTGIDVTGPVSASANLKVRRYDNVIRP